MLLRFDCRLLVDLNFHCFTVIALDYLLVLHTHLGCKKTRGSGFLL